MKMKIEKRNKNVENNYISTQNGITLITLVITIIILLILAGITVLTLVEDNGLFARAKQAKENTIDAQEKENLTLQSYENKIGEYVNGDRTLNIKDLELDYDNKVDIKAYKSNSNKYIVPSTGIIMVSAESTGNGLTRAVVNGININICGRSGGAWNNGGYSQIVCKNNNIYFYVENGSSLSTAYFIPFK